jgi:hypothetical protein
VPEPSQHTPAPGALPPAGDPSAQLPGELASFQNQLFGGSTEVLGPQDPVSEVAGVLSPILGVAVIFPLNIWHQANQLLSQAGIPFRTVQTRLEAVQIAGDNPAAPPSQVA